MHLQGLQALAKAAVLMYVVQTTGAPAVPTPRKLLPGQLICSLQKIWAFFFLELGTSADIPDTFPKPRPKLEARHCISQEQFPFHCLSFQGLEYGGYSV